MSRFISQLIDVLCAPIVKRVGRQLNPRFEELRHDIKSLRRGTEPPFLPLLVKSELEHIEHLPLPYLRSLANLIIVGYHGEDVAATLPGAQFLRPPFTAAAVPECNLLFLNEYHAISLLRQVATFPVSRRGMIMTPFTGDFTGEDTLRQILHELGHVEICWLDYDRSNQGLVVSGISHPEPISCMPLMVTPGRSPGTGTRWLRASRTVLENGCAD